MNEAGGDPVESAMNPIARLATLALLLLSLAGTTALAQPAPAPPPLFAFHSSPWINLHHFLWSQSKPKAKAVPEPAWSASEKAAWQAAIEYYRANLAERSPLFDRGMTDIRDRLAALPDSAAVTSAGLDSAVTTVLASAEPVYRTHFWPAHDAANRRAITQLEAFAASHRGLADKLCKALAATWPDVPVRVDLSVDADWAGAYTTIEPTHVTIAADDPRHQGDAGLEVLFHETAHGLFRNVSNALAAEVKKQGVKLPSRDLWHAMLFYTVGELVRRDLPAGYVPYAEKQGLYRGAWADYQTAMKSHWLPYLDGKVPLEEAIAKIVAAVGVMEPKTPQSGG